MFESPDYIHRYRKSSVFFQKGVGTMAECGILCIQYPATCKAFVVVTRKTLEQEQTCKLLNSEERPCSPGPDNDDDPEFYDVKYYEALGLNASFPDQYKEKFRLESSGVLRTFHEIWKSDCYQSPCDSQGVVGFNNNDEDISRDIDYLICGSHSRDLQLIATSGQTVTITSTGNDVCGRDEIVTAVLGNSLYWTDLVYYKCLRLSLQWKVDTGKCVVRKQPALELKCPDVTDGQYFYVTGLWRTTGRTLSHIKCCPVVRK
ncbi:Uncharacterised protein at_DN2412 [Pycnogonum litorale]